MMMYLTKSPDTFVALVAEVDAGRYSTSQRREGNEKIQPVQRGIHTVRTKFSSALLFSRVTFEENTFCSKNLPPKRQAIAVNLSYIYIK